MFITSRGPGVPMEDIARAAGVAVGTLYRHFPTKADLVAATLEQHIASIAEQLESSVRRIGDGAPAREEIRSLFLGWVESHSDSRILKEAARSLGAYSTESDAMVRMDGALRRLLQQGAGSGDLRPDVEPADIYLLMSTMPADEPDESRRRWVEIISRGLLRTA
ncbi:TetR/AcrR family transcriptional regulator [Arthrobacter luteolus]